MKIQTDLNTLDMGPHTFHMIMINGSFYLGNPSYDNGEINGYKTYSCRDDGSWGSKFFDLNGVEIPYAE